MRNNFLFGLFICLGIFMALWAYSLSKKKVDVSAAVPAVVEGESAK